MSIPNMNSTVEVLLYVVAISGVILMLLELLTIENPDKPMQECKKWKEDEEDEPFYVDKPPK